MSPFSTKEDVMSNYCVKCVLRPNKETIDYVHLNVDGSYHFVDQVEDATSFDEYEDAHKVSEYLNLIDKTNRDYFYTICDICKLKPDIVYAIKLKRETTYHKNFFINVEPDEGVNISVSYEWATTSKSSDELVKIAKTLLVLFPDWKLSIVEVDLNKNYRIDDNYIVVYVLS